MYAQNTFTISNIVRSINKQVNALHCKHVQFFGVNSMRVTDAAVKLSDLVYKRDAVRRMVFATCLSSPSSKQLPFVDRKLLHLKPLCYRNLYTCALSLNSSRRDLAELGRSAHNVANNSGTTGSDLTHNRKKRSSYTKTKKFHKETSEWSAEKEDDWSQSFGTLSTDVDKFLSKYTDTAGSYPDDEGEDDEAEKPFVRLSDINRKHSPFHYGRKIAKYGNTGKVYEAIEVLEKQMLKEDRVLPNQYVFTVLIGALGRVGYTKKAFQLFNRMKKFGLAPQDPTYTALFNACSNSPWPEDGLKRANHLRQLMAEKGHSPNIITINSMIKAYARCGDIQKAFGVIDEALAAGHKPRGPSYSFLLMACISNKDVGLKLAVEVWRLMRKSRVRPNAYHYNLLLRAVRDCGLGNADFANDLLRPTQKSLPEDKRSPAVNNVDELANPSTDSSENVDKLSVGNPVADNSATELEMSSSVSGDLINSLPCAAASRSGGCSIVDMTVPDLLDLNNVPTNLVRVNLPSTAEGRLSLLGGLPGILSKMQQDKAVPDIKTFSLFLDVIPSSRTAEADLLNAMALNGIRLDVDFYSMLIRKRILRHDLTGAREVLAIMDKAGVKPNIRTFGCLAMGCRSRNDAMKLIKHIEAADMVPNIEICNILLFQSRHDFSYKLTLLHTMKRFGIRPNQKFIADLETTLSYARKMIIDKERGEPVPEFFMSDFFQDGYRKFVIHYKSWLMSMQSEPDVHPWSRFQQPTPSIDRMKAEKDNFVG